MRKAFERQSYDEYLKEKEREKERRRIANIPDEKTRMTAIYENPELFGVSKWPSQIEKEQREKLEQQRRIEAWRRSQQ